MQRAAGGKFCGFASTFVVSALIFDEELFNVFEENWEELMALKGDKVEHVIRRSIELKAKVIRQDERELLGKRILLNYGHL